MSLDSANAWAERELHRAVLYGTKDIPPEFAKLPNACIGAGWRHMRAHLPVRMRILFPPPPETAEGIQYSVGFTFGIFDSLISLLELPLQIAIGILKLIQWLAGKPNIWKDLEKLIDQNFSFLWSELKQAGLGDPFTQGVITGRLIVNLVLSFLLIKNLIKKGLSIFTTTSSGTLPGSPEETHIEMENDIASSKIVTQELNAHGITLESAASKTSTAIKSDLEQAREKLVYTLSSIAYSPTRILRVSDYKAFMVDTSGDINPQKAAYELRAALGAERAGLISQIHVRGEQGMNRETGVEFTTVTGEHIQIKFASNSAKFLDKIYSLEIQFKTDPHYKIILDPSLIVPGQSNFDGYSIALNARAKWVSYLEKKVYLMQAHEY